MQNFIDFIIGGFAGAAAVFILHGNIKAASVMFFIGWCLDLYAQRKSWVPVGP